MLDFVKLSDDRRRFARDDKLMLTCGQLRQRKSLMFAILTSPESMGFGRDLILRHHIPL